MYVCVCIHVYIMLNDMYYNTPDSCDVHIYWNIILLYVNRHQPVTMMSVTPRWFTAYSRTDKEFKSFPGTRLPMLRWTNTSPGLHCLFMIKIKARIKSHLMKIMCTPILVFGSQGLDCRSIRSKGTLVSEVLSSWQKNRDLFHLSRLPIYCYCPIYALAVDLKCTCPIHWMSLYRWFLKMFEPLSFAKVLFSQ